MTHLISYRPLLAMVITSMTNGDLFDGHLLGDASIVKTNINKDKNYSFVLCSKHEQYLKWCAKQMLILNSRPIWQRVRSDMRTNKIYKSYWIRSLASEELTLQRRRWYPNGIKTIPSDLTINNNTLLTWFLDDGSLATKGGIYLATDCFTKESLNTVQKILYRNFTLESTLHKNGNGFRIYFTKGETEKFFDKIGECPVDCFSYKWNR